MGMEYLYSYEQIVDNTNSYLHTKYTEYEYKGVSSRRSSKGKELKKCDLKMSLHLK